MSFKSREKKRRRKLAIANSRREHGETMKARHYLTIVSRSACCNDCGGTLRTGGECVFRFEPKEILCIVCADLRNLKYRPSLRWEKAARERAKGLARRT